MGRWKAVLKTLAVVGRTAAGAAVQAYTGGVVPASVITGKGEGAGTSTQPQAPTPQDAARAKFRQWPPAADEVTPGEGGGVTPGISRDQLEVLGYLWLVCPHRPMLGFESPTESAVAYVAGRFGWVEVTNPRQLDPDQFYVARMWLREWVATGVEPKWPARTTNPAPTPTTPTTPPPPK